MTAYGLLIHMYPCDVSGCDARATRFWMKLGFCSDCAGAFDAQRLSAGLRPMQWETEPCDEAAE